MTCGIYMIQNKVNGKIYIGQAVDIEDRWKKHKKELRGNYHINKHLQRSWNKYGEDNFEFTIICECDENQLNTMEEYYIFGLMSYDGRVGYNKTYGGDSGRPTEETKKKMSEAQKGKSISEETRKKLIESHKGKTLPEEQRKKISESVKIALSRPEVRKKLSEASKGENNPWYGKHFSEEHRKKLSEAKKGKYCGENNPMYGKHLSAEHRKKLSEALKGKYCGENSPLHGKPKSEEHRKKMSDAQKGKTLTEEHKKKIGEAVRGEKNPMYGKRGAKHNKSIPIVQLTLEGELINVYGASMDAARNGFNHGNINQCIKGRRKTHKGYKWMYLHEYISNMHPNIKKINLMGKTYEVNQEEVKIE